MRELRGIYYGNKAVFLETLSNFKSRFKIALISSLTWGLLAHGMALFNKYSTHDDIAGLFCGGSVATSGRWLGEFLATLGAAYFWGSPEYSFPLLNGLFFIALIAVTVCLIIYFLDIKRSVICVTISGIMVTFPVVTAFFGYMFMVPQYALSIFMSVLGVCLICRGPKFIGFAVGSVFICLAMGIYQAFVPLCLSLMLFHFMKDVLESEIPSWKRFWLEASYLALSCIVFIVLYFCVTKFVLWYKNLTLTDYMGINKMGQATLNDYLFRIKCAYSDFLSPTLRDGAMDSMYPLRTRHLYKIALVFAAILSVRLLYRANGMKKLQMLILMLCIPLCVNFIFIMSEPERVHSLMVYGQSMFLVYVAWLVDYPERAKRNSTNKWACTLGTVLLLLFAVMYCRYDNICYLKTEFEQQRTISYFTTLVARIKSADGYQDELPVVYINSGQNEDSSIRDIKGFSTVKMIPLHGGAQSLINDYVWTRFMDYWCGFSPVEGDEAAFADLPEVREMPRYPDDGSIKRIEDTIVVKF